MSMTLRRATRAETISSEITLHLAEMLFIRHYGSDHTNEQLPLTYVDRGDRWDIHENGKALPGQRLKMAIMKTDERIVELVSW